MAKPKMHRVFWYGKAGDYVCPANCVLEPGDGQSAWPMEPAYKAYGLNYSFCTRCYPDFKKIAIQLLHESRSRKCQ